MRGESSDPQALAAAGFAALKRGDAAAGRDLLERACEAGAADSATWFGLAAAHAALGESARQSAALDQALKLDTNHLPSLIAKGDLFARSGDRRAANSYYVAGLKQAAKLASLPPEWRAELARIEAISRGFARDFETRLREAVTRGGMGGPGTERFAHAVDLLLGKRQIYQQQPKYFYFPELPQIQFFDRRAFPWVAALEAAWPGICAEVRDILDAGRGIVPYIARKSDRPADAASGVLLDSLAWGAFFLIKDGVEVAENAARCPRTLAALKDVPLCRIDHRTPSVLFSILRPGARIPPHHGFMNARLICHLPLIVPPACGMRVGNETRDWREGEVVIFDDSIEHEAWNRSGETRAVLIFDVWRPELSATERALIATMLEAVDQFDGPRRNWVE